MSNYGKVYLVGAGPGDPGLISVKGLACLQDADWVLYDGLVNPLLLQHTSAHAERTCRVAAGDGRALPQAEINQRLIDAAKQGKTVVRLKGGDPFIFGRGSEEAAALRAEGIEYEVIPGITAATAASAYAGISLTHRDSASAVAFITGHEDPSKPESALDYQTLAAFPGTLVFYMGLHRLAKISESLISAGKDPSTPACVISRATTPLQQTVTGSLADLPQKVIAAKLHAPSLIVVGEVINQRKQLAWFEQKPLFGQKVGITRPARQVGSEISKAIELGAQPVLMPTIEILPPETKDEIEAIIDRIDEFDWLVFTSVNGVESFLTRLWAAGHDSRCLSGLKIAAIGSSTARKIESFHLRADVIPDEFRAESLAKALKPLVNGKKVLWAKADRGRDILPKELVAAGATVEELVVYRNIDVESFPNETVTAIENGDINWIGISSPSIARNLHRLLSQSESAFAQIGKTVRLASISPVTTSAAQEVGLTISAEATEFTWDGIFQAIVDATP